MIFINSVKFLAIRYSNIFSAPFFSLLLRPKFIYAKPFDIVPQLLDVSYLFSLCYTLEIVNPSSGLWILFSAVSSLRINLLKEFIFDITCLSPGFPFDFF